MSAFIILHKPALAGSSKKWFSDVVPLKKEYTREARHHWSHAIWEQKEFRFGATLVPPIFGNRVFPVFPMEDNGLEQPSISLRICDNKPDSVSLSGATPQKKQVNRSPSTKEVPQNNIVHGILKPCENGSPLPPKLARIANAWPSLPPHIQETITTLVDTVFPVQENFECFSVPTVQSTRRNRVNLQGISKDTLRSTVLKALRHSPELYALNMDANGWVDAIDLGYLISQLIGTDSIFDCDDVLWIFQEIGLNDRVQFKHGFVRAAYGHSSDRFAPEEKAVPDQLLFHGTSAANWSMIECFGLSPAKRRFVQLTTNFGYANQIANSHSRSPIMLKVATAEAIALGVEFYSTDTHVWLATAVPATCLQVWLDDTFGLEEPLF